MPDYIGNQVSNQAQSNAQDFLGRTPYVGSIQPKAIFKALTGKSDYASAFGKSMAAAGAGWGGGYIPESANKQPVATDIPPRPVLEQIIYFQYFPETISDSRELNVEEMRPFFLSNSIPTISGSSPRNLGFTIRFSRERWLYGQELSEFDWDKYNVDVALAIQVIRSMTYPNAQIGNIGIIPQPVKLTLPGTGIGINSDTVVGLITSYSAEYLAFFPDGQPRLANVALQFSEYPIYDVKNITRSHFADVLRGFSQRMSRVVHPAEKAPEVGITNKTDVSGIWTVREKKK